MSVAVPLPVHGAFTYRAPDGVAVGASVMVPFGPRAVNGWVVGEGAPYDEIKDIGEVLDFDPAFTAEQLAFYRWIAEYYLAPLGEVIATATPSGATARTRHVYVPTPEGVERIATNPLEGEVAAVLREVIARPAVTRSTLMRRLHGEVADVSGAIAALLAAELIAFEDHVIEGPQDMETWLLPTGKAGVPRSPQGKAGLAALPCLASELSPSVVVTLVRQGLARKEERKRVSEWTPGRPATDAPVLNAAQNAVIAAVGESGAYLLHGVTGAGKTEVYLSLAKRTLAAGKQVLVLVPEISLTPQLTTRFDGRFPGEVAVLHSGLTGAERLREWRRIQAGGAAIVIGARSALFAPFQRLGLVIVDEENDDSYKQDDGVRYHARDLAVVRAQMAGCPCILGSATPSLESWRNAMLGRYKLLQLRDRATPRAPSALRVVDMRHEPKIDGKEPLLSAAVDGAIREALAAGGKAILLYNRRGYATFVECPGCGQGYECPSCGIGLVLHQAARRLDCHYCGFHRHFNGDCPKCGTTLDVLGRGTERVEEQVVEAFPGVPVARMDADTTGERGSHARILDAFRAGESRILVGTQIVAKGHDFPDVHVAAVLGVDHILGMPDFRASERSFALVTQLIGRAGRGEIAGRVFLQTHHPDHPVFSAVGDMEAFANGEMRLREMLGYPPYSRLAMIRVEGVSRQDVRAAVDAIATAARASSRGFPGVDVLGPAAAPMARLVGRWRFQIILRGRNAKIFRSFLNAHHKEWKVPHGIRKIVDVDVRSVM